MPVAKNGHMGAPAYTVSKLPQSACAALLFCFTGRDGVVVGSGGGIGVK